MEKVGKPCSSLVDKTSMIYQSVRVENAKINPSLRENRCRVD